MDPVPLAIALAPIALYLLALGFVHMRRRPVVWSGTIDNSALAVAIAGLAVVGPMQMLMPDTSHFSGTVLWALMLSFYGLSVTLVNLLSRPRLVVFNTSADTLHGLLAQLLPRIDAQGSRAGDSYQLPQAGVQFHLEPYPPLQTVSLISIGTTQSISGWRRLKRELTGVVDGAAAPSGSQGLFMAVAGVVLLGYALWRVSELNPMTATQQLRNILRDTGAVVEPINKTAESAEDAETKAEKIKSEKLVIGA